jgi:alpha-glucosidase
MSLSSLWLRLAAAGLAIATAAPLAAQVPAASVAAQSDGVEAHRGAVAMRVTALTDSILRVRIARDGQWPEDASWAVAHDRRAQSVRVVSAEDGFATARLRVHVTPDLRLVVTDSAGRDHRG